MPYNNNGSDEANVEGLVGEFCGRMPWNDPQGCRNVMRLFGDTVERMLANRAARILAQDEEYEKNDKDDRDN
jgi:hypothetical protein